MRNFAVRWVNDYCTASPVLQRHPRKCDVARRRPGDRVSFCLSDEWPCSFAQLIASCCVVKVARAWSAWSSSRAESIAKARELLAVATPQTEPEAASTHSSPISPACTRAHAPAAVAA